MTPWFLMPALAFGLVTHSLAQVSEVRLGLATVDITPPMGMPMAGYYHERGADGVLDPLYSKAMVIEQEGQRVAIVVLDIISVTRWITDQARAQVEKATGIPGGRVMISATHAHTGPELANRTRRSAEAVGKNKLALDYTEALPELIARSVALACERLQPAQLSVAKGRCEDLAFNRRFYMQDGTVGWNPGKLNPKIAMPAGSTDPEVGILYAAAPGPGGRGQARLTYVNFAMHPDTTGGSKFSADWPGALGRVLGGYHGSEHLTIVANGTCGNLNHVDVSWAWTSSGSNEQNRIAVVLGAAVLQAYKGLKPIAGGALQAKSAIVELSLPEATPEQVAEAKAIVQSTKNDRGTNFMRLVRAYRTLGVADRKGEPQRVEVQVIALGREVAWVGLPGEIFVELGLALKKRSPFPSTFVAELANECVGYVPDRRSYDEGNYEPESARCAAGSGEKLVDAAASLLRELFEQATPGKPAL